MAKPGPDGLIRCYNCGEGKTDNSFHRNSARYDGRDSTCKACKHALRVQRIAKKVRLRDTKNNWLKRIEEYNE